MRFRLCFSWGKHREENNRFWESFFPEANRSIAVSGSRPLCKPLQTSYLELIVQWHEIWLIYLGLLRKKCISQHRFPFGYREDEWTLLFRIFGLAFARFVRSRDLPSLRSLLLRRS